MRAPEQVENSQKVTRQNFWCSLLKEGLGDEVMYLSMFSSVTPCSCEREDRDESVQLAKRGRESPTHLEALGENFVEDDAVQLDRNLPVSLERASLAQLRAVEH